MQNKKPESAKIHTLDRFSDPSKFPGPADAHKIEWLCPYIDERPFNSMHAFGMASWLWTQSPMHRSWECSALGQFLLPAIASRQFLIARDPDFQPLAYVSWAKFDVEAEMKYLRSANSIQQLDWETGDRIWFIDWIAPFGGSRIVARKLEKDIFPDDVGHSLHVKIGASNARIIDHFGVNVTPVQKIESIDKLKTSLKNAFF